MEIAKPIFIVGTGRCGSTIFHDIFACHPDVSWLSPWCDKYPHKPQVNRSIMQMADLSWLNQYVRKFAGPQECYPFWEYHSPGFSEPFRDLCREDVSSKVKTKVRQVMNQMITPRRKRLLLKITGWPRIGFLKEIFPDAKFIHVYRDGRAVINSLLSVSWWLGWRGPKNWRWGELTVKQREVWEKYNKSFVILAAIEWEILMAAYEKAKRSVPADDYLEIKYEELCRTPLQTFRQAVEFCELEWSPRFEAAISTFNLRNTNDKWRKDLSSAQQAMLDKYLKDTLAKYGYS